jgi:outer membrane protein assembly factor BamB
VKAITISPRRTGLAFFVATFSFAANPAVALDWPQWLGPDRDGVWRETGLIEKFSDEGPTVLWRIPLAAGYSGPAVAGDSLYVMDRERATDESGKPVRPTRQGIPGNERVHCLDVKDGSTRWKQTYDCRYTISYPSGPRTTPLFHEGRLYTLGAMGDLMCLEADTGKVVWSKNLAREYNAEPPVWGFAAHPLIDGELLYSLAGGEGSAVVALRKDTGAEVWRALSSGEVGYSPPMIYEIGGQRQLVIWLSEAIYGLDPTTGEQRWKHEYPVGEPPQRPAVNIATVKQVHEMLFISTFYHGPMMLRPVGKGPSQPSVVWSRKNNSPGPLGGVHCLMASPVFKDGYGYAVGRDGDLRCFQQDTGDQMWLTYDAVAREEADCGTAFLVPQGDRFVLFNDQGDLIFANLTPQGYQEVDRAHILEPAEAARGRQVVWSHPAFAQRCVFARNEKEMVCVSLAMEG